MAQVRSEHEFQIYDGYGHGARVRTRGWAVMGVRVMARVRSQDKCSVIYDGYGHGVKAGVWSRRG